MYIKKQPDALEKLTRMGDVTLYEPAGDSPYAETRGKQRRQHESRLPLECISHVTTPQGKKPVLKAMVTTACEKNCYYCPFRAGRGSMERLTFKPDELARTFDAMQQAGMVDGLFLSSGIISGGMRTQDKLLDTVEIVRKKYAYRGYIHLKIMPGAEQDQILRAMQLADRVSINLEGPTPQRLNALAPKKDFDNEVFNRLQWAAQLKQASESRLASLVTQFVVGAVGDTDLELLSLTHRLYSSAGLARTYFSAFSPVRDTPFDNLPRVTPQRELRLYQASFLLRDYAWDVEDLPFQGVGDLRLDVDPKHAWADHHLRHAPVDLMHADYHTLLRVPGIGPVSAKKIIKSRQQGTLRELAQLRALGIRAPEQAAPYILLDGRRPQQQLALF